MKYKLYALLSLSIICLVTLFSGQTASAQNASPEQNTKPGLYILSRTDTTNVTDVELAGVYRNADVILVNQIRDGLSSREIKAIVVESEQDIAANPTRFVLIVKVDKVELGAKRPFGRTAKVKVSYTLQNKDRSDIVSRSHEETSVQKWQNCIKKISEETVTAVANDIEKKPAGKTAEAEQSKLKQTSTGSSEARLRELEDLKAKGLITEKEYETKRKDILKDL